MNETADTAILLFAHDAAHETKYKSFCSGHAVARNKEVAEVLLQHTFSVVKQSKLPLVTVLTAQQSGRTFGERLANAFQDAFEAGYQRVICIGSDCPALSAADLRTAGESLQQHDMVIGPAADGGAYLIGMHISCFDPEAFAMLNWQTGKVLDELTLYSFRQHSTLGCFALLAPKADIDSAEDFTRVLQRLPFRLRIKLLIIYKGHFLRFPLLRNLLLKPLELYLSKLLLRAPPF
ncbi:DUF2064 domain-containing protein [Pontibacter sp. 172403-2]|uniref:TIGR04282 family arsenosugar biosynthesis glycosyltransferase n=1 Tax=Pontibacter rufus TaxID=2791028 RepID=UPI0018AFCF5A|nr:DUF2064 domain-containing protein [Pontibacter sp. 172403-2]MBF9254191.1 DUF2064 domain-containing protein [Pontibacter sp. 172403-2]